jgi:hypothetical protein
VAGVAEGDVPGGAAFGSAQLAWTATSTAPTSSGVSLYRLDKVTRAPEPAMLLWTTIRIV